MAVRVGFEPTLGELRVFQQFPVSTDYLITPEGCRALMGLITWTAHPLVSAPSDVLESFRQLGSGLPYSFEVRFP